MTHRIKSRASMIFSYFAIPTIAFLISGCTGGVDTVAWEEEIELVDGKILVLEREESRVKSGVPLSVRGAIKERKIKNPRSGVSWIGDVRRVPIAFEVEGNATYLAVTLMSRDLCAMYENPPGSVIFLKADGVSWTRIKKEDYPINAKANLLVNPWGKDESNDVRGLVKNFEKQLAAPYNRLVNQPLSVVLSNNSRDSCRILSSGS